MLVVFQHAFFAACISRGESYTNEFPINYGRLGVVLFFSISGFVIALNRTRPIKEFILHRLLRIYPSYWLAIVLTLPLLYFTTFRAHVSVEAALLWPSDTESGLRIPYWTLIFEVVFYCVATVLFSARLKDRTLTVIAITWIAVINICQHNAAHGSDFCFPGYWIMLSPIMQVLPMGFLCALHFRHIRKVPALILIGAAVVAYAMSFHFPDLTVQRHLFLGLCTSLCVAAVAEADVRMKALAIMGNASYGIYLLHFPIILFVSWLLPPMPLVVATALFLTIGTGLGTLFGIMDHWVYKKNTRKVVAN